MECANENLRADFDRWNQIKSRDLKNILQEMADLHIRMYEQVCLKNLLYIRSNFLIFCWLISH